MTNKKQSHNGEDEVIFENIEETSSFKKKGEDKKADELETLRKERGEYLDGWQRAKAELVNFKKDIEQDKKKYREHAAEDLVSELIPVLDSFDMAFRDTVAWAATPENWRRGIEHIHSQLLSVLERVGVIQLNPKGEAFNPALHEPLDMKPVSDESEDGIIQEVMQKGYQLHGKLIRAPKVVVGQFDKE